MTSILTGVFASQISGHLLPLTGSYDALATVTVPSGGASSITFSGIPQTGYKHLQVRMFLPISNSFWVDMKANATDSSYGHFLWGTGSAASASSYSSVYNSSVALTAGSATTPTAAIIDILDYANINKNKTFRTLSGFDANGSGQIYLISNLYNSTLAVNSLTFSGGTFTQYAMFSLYGVK